MPTAARPSGGIDTSIHEPLYQNSTIQDFWWFLFKLLIEFSHLLTKLTFRPVAVGNWVRFIINFLSLYVHLL